MTIRVTTLLCDNVRQEINGKLSLMGVYGGGDVVFPRLPAAAASLAFFQLIAGLDVGSYEVEHRLLVQSITQGLTDAANVIKDDINIVDASKPVVIVRQYQPVVFPISGTCELRFQIRRDKKVIHEEGVPFQVEARPEVFAK